MPARRKEPAVRLEDLPELMTIRDVVRISHLERHTVYRHIEIGRLPAFLLAGNKKLGWRIKREDFERWLLGKPTAQEA